MATTIFEVGDTVKILKNNEHVNAGDLGKILMVHPKDYYRVHKISDSSKKFFGLYNWEMESVTATTTKFRVGDRVKKIRNTYDPMVETVSQIGWTGTVKSLDCSKQYRNKERIDVNWDCGKNTNPFLDEIELVGTTTCSSDTLSYTNMQNVWANNIAPSYYYTPGYSCNDETIVASSLWTKTKTMLNTLTTALRKALSPALQKQYRAGLINGGLELTSRGQQELLAILAEEKSKELTAVAQEIIDEAEKD